MNPDEDNSCRGLCIFISMKTFRKFLWTGTWILTAIGILMVLRRIGIMAGMGWLISPRFPFDSGLHNYPVLTTIHIIPGLIFILLGPFQFRRMSPAFLRKSGNVFIAVSYIIGFSALVMPFIILPLGGINEAVASCFFALYFLFSITQAFRAKQQYLFARNREWMLRAYAVGLAIATVRPIMALSFVFFGMRPQTFLGTAFWIGFSMHAIVAEIWIQITRNKTADSTVIQMFDIFQDFIIKASVSKVFDAMTTSEGLEKWWTKKSSGKPAGGETYSLWFGVGHDWHAVVSKCIPGKEFEFLMKTSDRDWNGTRVGFMLDEKKNGTIVHFYHVGWPSLNEHYRLSAYWWAMYLRILKRYVENGEEVAYENRLDM